MVVAEVGETPGEDGGLGEQAVVVQVDEEAAVGEADEPVREVAVLGPERARPGAELLEVALPSHAAAACRLAVGDHAVEPSPILWGDGRAVVRFGRLRRLVGPRRPEVVGREAVVEEGQHRDFRDE